MNAGNKGPAPRTIGFQINPMQNFLHKADCAGARLNSCPDPGRRHNVVLKEAQISNWFNRPQLLLAFGLSPSLPGKHSSRRGTLPAIWDRTPQSGRLPLANRLMRTSITLSALIQQDFTYRLSRRTAEKPFRQASVIGRSQERTGNARVARWFRGLSIVEPPCSCGKSSGFISNFRASSLLP